MNALDLAQESFRLIETGDRELAETIIAADFVNYEADDDDEPERQERGPEGFLATSRWLRAAFADLRFEPEGAAERDGTVFAATTMTGRHTGAFQGIAPTGRSFRQRQVHIYTVADGRLTSHRAVRDDLGLLFQLGWRP